MKMQNVLKMLGYAIVGGLCAFTWGFLLSVFFPKELDSSVAFNLAPAILAIAGIVAALLFLKAPKRIPVVLFFVGFLLLTKLFDGIVANIFSK